MGRYEPDMGGGREEGVRQVRAGVRVFRKII